MGSEETIDTATSARLDIEQHNIYPHSNSRYRTTNQMPIMLQRPVCTPLDFVHALGWNAFSSSRSISPNRVSMQFRVVCRGIAIG